MFYLRIIITFTATNLNHMNFKDINSDIQYIYEKLMVEREKYTQNFSLKINSEDPFKSYIKYDRWFIHIQESRLLISDGTLKNKLFAPIGLKGLLVILECYENLNK